MPKEKAQFSTQRLSAMLLDLAAVTAAFYLAFLLRFDFELGSADLQLCVGYVVYAWVAYLIAGQLCGLNRGLYYAASGSDNATLVQSVGLGGVLTASAILFATQGQFPRSVLMMHPILTLCGQTAGRALARFFKNRFKSRRHGRGPRRVALMVGAGEMGALLLRQMLASHNPRYKVLGFIDDDQEKWGMHLDGVPVLGGREILPAVLAKNDVDEIVISVAARRGELVSSLMEAIAGAENKPELKIAPSLEEMLRSPFINLQARKVNPADLLNREVIRLDTYKIDQTIAGKVVLVSGAGGTIGGELCRQALQYQPAKIILLENHATALFYREAELRAADTGVTVVPALGDVKDHALIERLFQTHKPQIVLHAAAHKHVFQLESNIQEGILNNTLGTYTLAAAAERHGADVFLLVSTDKAVRPSNVMGATKRAAEIVVRSMAQRGTKTRFVAVRFGNVLGSSGSVLKIFQEQISLGGPVTVTDPRVTRYFMTVEESVGLILQAASLAKGGEIFVLKMGTPVRIMDMAVNLIKLSGLQPGKDIEIKITGLKQGEKLDEELVEDAGGTHACEHPDIMVLRSENDAITDLPAAMLELEVLSRGTDGPAALRKLRELVPTFTPAPAHLRS